MRVRTHFRAGGLVVAASAVLTVAGTASADDVLDAWTVVPAQALDAERGRNIDDLGEVGSGSASAVNIADQSVVNFFNVDGNVAAGDMVSGSHTFANQTMSINAFNTGNNVTMMNQLSIHVTVSNLK